MNNTLLQQSVPLLVGTCTVLWYLTSFKNAIATQQLVRMSKNGLIGDEGSFGIMVALTFLQLLIGLFAAKVLSWFCDRMIAGNESAGNKPSSSVPVRILIGILHYLGSLSTNLGFAYGNASVVQSIKLLEPIETLILTMMVGTVSSVKSEITLSKAISVVVIVSGTSLLLSSSSIQANINIKSVAYALISGIALSSRNVAQKTFVTRNTGRNRNAATSTSRERTSSMMLQIAVRGLDTFISITCYSLVPSFFALLRTEYNRYSACSMINGNLALYILTETKQFGVQAAVFHGLYNLFSICTLTLVSAPTHSLLNVGKRVTIVLATTLYFHEHLGTRGILGLVIAGIGGWCYSRGKASEKNSTAKYLPKNRQASEKNSTAKYSTKNRIKMACLGALVFSLFTCLRRYQSTPVVPEKLIEPPIFTEESIKRNHKNVVLFGPHDRYNFGDLLFTKVLLRLLQTRAGYKEDEIVLGGIVSVNMTRYGGEGKILSMRSIQGLSWEDKIKGPYDIVYTGGESTGCTHDCAASMFTENKDKCHAHSEIYDCGYLIPKDFLVPKSEEAQKVTNRAIVNSVGGIPTHPACKRAVDSADFVAFRDHEPLYPDSAVMTRELYGEKINSLAKEVMQELFHNNTAGQKKYIAVQHKVCSSDVAKKLASALDIVSKESGATIVFLAAGTAPKHDSFASYKKVASFMKEPSVVYEAEHVWKVVAVISGAEAVLGTSLHIRIMAFIHWKPRITWCTRRNDGDGKHDQFISLWDIGSAECLEDSSQTWSVLSGYLGANANITQLETTKISYYKAVKKYLEGFDKWSCLLRNRSGCNGGEN